MPLYLVPVWSSTKTYPVYVVLLVSGAGDSFCERPRRRPLHRPSPCARCSPRRAALVPPRHLPSNSCSTALEPSTVRLVSVEPSSVWGSVAPRRCAAVRGVASWLPQPDGHVSLLPTVRPNPRRQPTADSPRSRDGCSRSPIYPSHDSTVPSDPRQTDTSHSSLLWLLFHGAVPCS